MLLAKANGIMVEVGSGQSTAGCCWVSQNDGQLIGYANCVNEADAIDLALAQAAQVEPRAANVLRERIKPCPACKRPHDCTRIPPPRVPLSIACACCCMGGR